MAAALRQTGAALVHTIEVLDCPYDGMVAHEHDDACYDEDGELVCELPERELHEHTEDCYDEDGELVCGEEEILRSHQHGAGCFETYTVIGEPLDDEPEADDDALEPDPDDALDADPTSTHPARSFS